MDDAGRIADEIEASLRAVGTPERAEGEKAYLKSDLEFLGVTLGQIRKAARSRAKDPSRAEAIALAQALWAKPIFDRRLAATIVLEAGAGCLVPDDLELLERLVRESRTWALVDNLADDVLGRLLLAHPDAVPRLDRWAIDDDFWVRRAALLAQLRPLKAGAPLDRFAGYADAMLDEREFFIRKAIGWVLRETGKRRPDEVFAWLRPRVERASGVTIREAVKYLEPAQRDALLDARRR